MSWSPVPPGAVYIDEIPMGLVNMATGAEVRVGGPIKAVWNRQAVGGIGV